MTGVGVDANAVVLSSSEVVVAEDSKAEVSSSWVDVITEVSVDSKAEVGSFFPVEVDEAKSEVICSATVVVDKEFDVEEDSEVMLSCAEVGVDTILDVVLTS